MWTFLSEQICNGNKKDNDNKNNKKNNIFPKPHIFTTDNCYHILNTNETKSMAFGLESNKRFKRENYPGKSQPKWQISPVLAIEDQDQIQKIKRFSTHGDPFGFYPFMHLEFATSIVALVIVPKEFLTTWWQGCDGYHQTKLDLIFFNTF